MRRLPTLPPWLRRGLEGALLGGLLAVATLTGTRLSTGGDTVVLPAGLLGSVMLAPAVLGLAVIAGAYPVALAATRTDAVLGAVAAVLLSVDATVVLTTGHVMLPSAGSRIGLGALAGLLAAGPALAGLVAGQVATPLGFGRRAGAWSAIVAAVAGVAVLLLASLLG